MGLRNGQLLTVATININETEIENQGAGICQASLFLFLRIFNLVGEIRISVGGGMTN